MTVTPYVYSFAPGANSFTNFVNKLNDVFTATGLPHHWEIESYTPGTSIRLKCKASPNVQLTLTGTSTEMTCTFSVDGYVTQSGSGQFIPGSSGINTLVLSINPALAYVVEVEDAISIMATKGASATTYLDNALSSGVHAGRIFSAHNKSDSTPSNLNETFAEYGMLTGFPGVSRGNGTYTNTYAWLPYTGNDTSGAGLSGSQIRLGSGGWGIPICPSTSSRSTNVADQLPLLAKIGDNANIDRLVPFPVSVWTPSTTSGVAGAHVGFTRYIRARDVGYGGSISNETVVNSTGSSVIAWRHNYYTSQVTVAPNFIHIWSQAGAIPV